MARNIMRLPEVFAGARTVLAFAAVFLLKSDHLGCCLAALVILLLLLAAGSCISYFSDMITRRGMYAAAFADGIAMCILAISLGAKAALAYFCLAAVLAGLNILARRFLHA